MRFYSGFRPGFRHGMSSLLTAGQNADRAYYDTLSALAQIERADAGAAKDMAEKAILDDVLAARRALTFSPGDVPEGVNPELFRTLVLLSKDPQVHNVTEALGDYQAINLRRQAADAARTGDFESVAALNAIASGDALPARFGVADGTLYGRYSGSQSPTDVGAAEIRKADAEARQAGFLANSGILFRLADMTAMDPRPYAVSSGNVLHQGTGAASTVAEQQAPRIVGRRMGLTDPVIEALEQFQATGQWPDRVPFAPGQAPAPVDDATLDTYNRAVAEQTLAQTADPTNAAKQYNELRAHGVPHERALAIAYDTYRQVQSPLGLEGFILDEATGAPAYNINSRGIVPAGTVPPAAAAASTVPPPEQRVVGQTYDTPRGKMIWMGAGWMPAPK